MPHRCLVAPSHKLVPEASPTPPWEAVLGAVGWLLQHNLLPFSHQCDKCVFGLDTDMLAFYVRLSSPHLQSDGIESPHAGLVSHVKNRL